MRHPKTKAFLVVSLAAALTACGSENHAYELVDPPVPLSASSNASSDAQGIGDATSSDALLTTTSETVVVELTPFEKVEKEDASLPKGVRRVTQEGIDGATEVTYQVISKGGVELSRTPLSERILTVSRDEITVIGTKSVPKYDDIRVTVRPAQSSQESQTDDRVVGVAPEDTTEKNTASETTKESSTHASSTQASSTPASSSHAADQSSHASSSIDDGIPSYTTSSSEASHSSSSESSSHESSHASSAPADSSSDKSSSKEDSSSSSTASSSSAAGSSHSSSPADGEDRELPPVEPLP